MHTNVKVAFHSYAYSAVARKEIFNPVPDVAFVEAHFERSAQNLESDVAEGQLDNRQPRFKLIVRREHWNRASAIEGCRLRITHVRHPKTNAWVLSNDARLYVAKVGVEHWHNGDLIHLNLTESNE